MAREITRRRVILIAAAAAGLGCLPLPAARAAGAPQPAVWYGTALGAKATIRLYHPDRAAAERLIARCVAEIDRLERQFGLYRPDSTLSRLNAEGAVAAPPLDFLRLLAESRSFSELTGGVFDVTVQPLWQLYAGHFARPDADPEGPAEEEVRRARERVGYRDLAVDPERIAFARPGMAATLNGIAQGYVTDRVADLLRAAGMDHVLLDLGEMRALGRRPDGSPWHVGLEDPQHPGQVRRVLDIDDRAVATSGAYGFRFDAAGRFHHLFDPATGRSLSRHASVSVVAPDATTADALSTAFALLPVEAIDRVLARRPGVVAHLVDADGRSRSRGTGAA